MGGASALVLWEAVAVSGIYHGLNPAMGWPLAVSAALMERRTSALVGALGMLALGHFLAMAVVLLPFSMFSALLDWETPVRLVAAGVAVAFGGYLLVARSHHPRYLARIAPHRLVWWSFLAATAHGAGLMLLPVFLSMDHGDHGDMLGRHAAVSRLLAHDTAPAVLVAAAHTVAMVCAGALSAVLVYRWLGLRVLSLTWINLDAVWAVSLVAVGVLGAAATLWW